MTRSIVWLIGLIASTAFHPSFASEIIVTPNEIKNLGIEFAAPEVASDVPAIEATARVVIPPMGDAIVSAPQSGLLAGLNVSVGEEVTHGQVMAMLQSSEFLALQREFLDALNANLLAQNEFERDQQLFDEGIVSGRRLQEATTRARIAATGFNEHRQLLQIAGLSDREIQSLENEQKFLQALEIRAPFDGVILDRMATAGERLDAMSPIYRLGDLSTLWLEINVPQEKLESIQVGMKVEVNDSPVQLPAEVTAIGRSVDPVTQAIMVRATLTETGHGLKPGQFVSVRIVAGHSDELDEAVWVVPAAAVTSSYGSQFLFVRTANGVDVREALILGADTNHAYLHVDIDADDSIAVIGVSALKALWSAQSESDG
jgi:cobalt-zinc-cadmium efflux system membrane fusion protein